MPAASTTARTAPPAMMPVPSGAGFSSTRPRRTCRRSRCGIVVPCQRHANQVLLRRLDALLDRRRHFLGLADAEADHAVAVADDDQGAEAQVLAALDDLRHAVDRDDGVLDVELRRRRCVHESRTFRTPDRLCAPHPPRRGSARDTGIPPRSKTTRLMPLSIDRSAIALPIASAPLTLPPRTSLANAPFSVRLDGRGRHERLAAQVVDDLRVDVRHAAEHARGAAAPSCPRSACAAAAESARGGRSFVLIFMSISPRSCRPSSSALRRCTGRPSACRDPACAAAGCSPPPGPTSCRSTPVTVMCVCLSIATSMPVGMSNTTGVRVAEREDHLLALELRRGSRRRRCRAPS